MYLERNTVKGSPCSTYGTVTCHEDGGDIKVGFNTFREEACAADILSVSTWFRNTCVSSLVLFHRVTKFHVGNAVRFVL